MNLENLIYKHDEHQYICSLPAGGDFCCQSKQFGPRSLGVIWIQNIFEGTNSKAQTYMFSPKEKPVY